MTRTSWIHCPQCRRDLNGDNESFVDDMGSEVRYTCATCNTNSLFELDAPVPIYLGAWLT